jgi:hypothetical protein
MRETAQDHFGFVDPLHKLVRLHESPEDMRVGDWSLYKLDDPQNYVIAISERDIEKSSPNQF